MGKAGLAVQGNHPGGCWEEVLPDWHCWGGVKKHWCWTRWCWTRWCWDYSSSGGSGAAQPALRAPGPAGCGGPRHFLATPHERASSAQPDLSKSTDRFAAKGKAEMSRQSFGTWQGFTACMEQAGTPQGGSVPKGELLSGNMMALWDRVASWPWVRSESVCSCAAHVG